VISIEEVGYVRSSEIGRAVAASVQHGMTDIMAVDHKKLAAI